MSEIQHVIGFIWLVIALASIWTGRVIWISRDTDAEGSSITSQKFPIIYSLCCGLQVMAAGVCLLGHPDTSPETLYAFLIGTPSAAALTLLIRKIRGQVRTLQKNLWALGTLCCGSFVILGFCFGLYNSPH